MAVTVLRLGHRRVRDARMSTHCGLVARAFGASGIIFSGEQDAQLINSVQGVIQKWGGPFSISYERNWKGVIGKHRKKGFRILHLTMYGSPLQKETAKLRKLRKLLVVIGAEKVPGEVYQLADFNVAVTNQPHSEVAALAIFLHEYFKGKELSKRFKGAKLRIIPQAKGKLVLKKRRDRSEAR